MSPCLTLRHCSKVWLLIVVVFLDAGASLSITDKDGKTALDRAHYGNQTTVAEILRSYLEKKMHLD